jgi:uncharacterized membrane protein
MGPVAGTLWRLLHVPGVLVPPASGNLWLNLYPLIPWPGIMALGFAFGSGLQRTPAQRRRVMLWLGAGSLLVFGLLRFSNLYGDPGSWKSQLSGERTFMSFLDVQKYPPSLLFVLATLGVSLCLMAMFDRWQAKEGNLEAMKPGKDWEELGKQEGRKGYWVTGRIRSILSVYGRVPFFYYFLHFTTIHLAALLTTAALGLDWRWWIRLAPSGGIFAGLPRGYGFSLPIVYLVWITIIALCYLPCRWFAAVKQRNRSPWLSYL